MPERESPKKIISASGKIELLQMVSEPNTGRYVSKDIGPPRGVNSEISYRLERRTKHSL